VDRTNTNTHTHKHKHKHKHNAELFLAHTGAARRVHSTLWCRIGEAIRDGLCRAHFHRHVKRALRCHRVDGARAFVHSNISKGNVQRVFACHSGHYLRGVVETCRSSLPMGVWPLLRALLCLPQVSFYKIRPRVELNQPKDLTTLFGYSFFDFEVHVGVHV
jgi:hypothetical protein